MDATFKNTTVWQTNLLWTAVAVLGAVAFAIVALNRGEAVNAAWLVVAAVCIYFIAYRFYGLFVAERALGVDGARITPAYRHNDREIDNFCPLFGFVDSPKARGEPTSGGPPRSASCRHRPGTTKTGQISGRAQR